MHRPAVGSGPGSGLVFGAGQNVAQWYGGGALGAVGVLVLEQQRGEVPTQVPRDMAGERAQEYVRADMVGGVDVDGAHLEPGRLEVAEGAPDAGVSPVGFDGLVMSDGVGGRLARTT